MVFEPVYQRVVRKVREALGFAVPLEVTWRRIQSVTDIGDLAREQVALRGPDHAQGNVRLAPGQAEHPVGAYQVDPEPGILLPERWQQRDDERQADDLTGRDGDLA